MGYTVIAPVGKNIRALYVGMKEFPVEKVILLVSKDYEKKSKEVVDKLREFAIEVELNHIGGNLLEDIFLKFRKILDVNLEDDILVNVATGDHTTSCASLSAAYANGLKAIDFVNDVAMLLPIMKLSYYNEITQVKLDVLKSLNKDKFRSLSVVANELNMSVSLLSYHINGTKKYKGLKERRLVETKNVKKTLCIKLSSMGNLLLKGYLN